VLTAPSFSRLLRSLPLTLSLESDDITLKKNFSRRNALASQSSRIHQKVDVLAGNLEIFHGIAHAHEFGKFLHSVTILIFYVTVIVVL
jgi:hypothetical protein